MLKSVSFSRNYDTLLIAVEVYLAIFYDGCNFLIQIISIFN